VKAAYVKHEDFNRLEMSHREMAADVVALTAVVAGIATAGAVDYERLEECVNFAAKTLRLGARPGLLAKASAVLGDIEKMQKALQIENRKNRGFRNEPFPNAQIPASPTGSFPLVHGPQPHAQGTADIQRRRQPS
jgi:hypothetical protein